jgi:vacuolar-type H+-ATPase subunit F/Vma7
MIHSIRAENSCPVYTGEELKFPHVLLIPSGSFTPHHVQLIKMKQAYLDAIAYSKASPERRLFARMYALFVREPDTDSGLGSHYLVDLVASNENCCEQVITVFCENNDIPIVLVQTNAAQTIRDIVKQVLETSPPRCAIVLDTRNNEILQKVRTRIARTHCDLRYRRVIFCVTDHVMPSGSTSTSLHVPGCTDDKMMMLLYHLPDHIRKQDASLSRFRTLSESMVDYTLFQPRVWRNVNVQGTIEEFLSSAHYQIVRRVRTDPGVGDAYPSFETEWRSTMASRLKHTLLTPPEALCPRIHRVIPIGVLPQDAIQAMTVAIPKDIQHPYAITVQTDAVDDQCGSIAITQPMNYTVVNVHCLLDPGLLVDVCRELRAGHKAVVSQVHSMQGQLTDIREEMKILVKHLSIENTYASDRLAKTTPNPHQKQCAKRWCSRIVTKRFRSGKFHRQCDVCIAQCNVLIAS